MNYLLILITGLYAAQAVVYFYSGNKPLALVVTGYVIANCGLILAAAKGV